jgi:FkbM family methyltransferase
MALRVKAIQWLVDINEKIIFYPKLKAFYKKALNENDIVVFDVGVNKGQTIDFFNSLNRKATVYGFEPNPTLFTKLTSKYNSNKNVMLHNIGISNTSGQLKFYENIMDETSSLEKLNYNSEYLIRKARILGVDPKNLISKEYFIEVDTLSDFFNKNNISKIDVLKIDTEGHELKCLEGLFNGQSKCKVSYIQLEQHYDDMYLDGNRNNEIVELLSKNKYAEAARIKHGFGNFHEIVFKNEE